MGLKSLFSKEGRKERALTKAIAKATNKKVKPDDRRPALHLLVQDGSADAIAGIRHWNQSLIDDPVMVRIFSKGVEDMNALDDDGRARFVVLMLNFLKTFENMHYQFSTGAMEPEVWRGWGELGALYLTAPGIRQYWSERRPLFSREFQTWMDGLEPPGLPRGSPSLYPAELPGVLPRRPRHEHVGDHGCPARWCGR